MKKNKNFTGNLENIDCDQLVPASYYMDLFPIRFGSQNVVDSIIDIGFKQDKPIVVRRLNGRSKKHEIVDGVCRWRGALAKNITAINVFVLELDDDSARAYTARENLKSGDERGASLSMVQAIVLEREIRLLTGDKNLMRNVLRATSDSLTTYKRALVTLKHAVDELLKTNGFTDLTDADFTKVIARAVTQKTWNDFTDFYSGEKKIFTFMRECYKGTETSKIKGEKFGFKNVRAAKTLNESPKEPSLVLKEILENLRLLGDFYSDAPGRSKLFADFQALMTPEREKLDSPERRVIEYLATEFDRYPILSNNGVNAPKKRSSKKRRRQPGSLFE